MKQEMAEILRVLRRAGNFNRLKFICVYGSAAEGRAGRLSGIDICLYYDMKSHETLTKLLYKISGMLPEKYDAQLFQLLPLTVKKEIFKGKFIYCEDKNLVYDLAFQTFTEYDEFEPRYKFNALNTRLKPHRIVI